MKIAAILWVALSPGYIALPNISSDKKKSDTMAIEYQPIGVFHTSLTPLSGAPRQGILQPENKGIIEIYEDYLEALRNLEDFEYIIVLYHMHLSKGWHPLVTPPRSKRPFGLFATRSPNRPNPIGFAVIKLDSINKNKLHVSGIDAFDETPVLDIKPWIPSIDCPAHKENMKIEEDLGLGKK